MRGRARWGASLGAVVCALLVSGSLLGVSSGRARIETSQTIRLIYGKTAEAHYALRDDAGRDSAMLDVFEGRLLDDDGTTIGSHHCECVNATGADLGWECTHRFSLRAGATTQRGMIVVTGPFDGFDGERLAIVGGTGAYANARGQAVSTVDGDDFVTTLEVTP